MHVFQIFKAAKKKCSKMLTALYFTLSSALTFNALPAFAGAQSSGSGSSSSGGGFNSIFQNQKTNISVGEVDANTLINNLVGVICGIASIIGIFMIITGVMKFFSAMSEGNPAEQSKAVKQIVIGVVFTSMGILVNFIFGTK